MNMWGIAKSLATGQLINSSAIWIFIVPAIAKLSETVNHQFWQFTKVAPNSLLLLYFSAIAFFLSSLIYKIRCPELIKNVNNFSDFESFGMTVFNISKTLENLNGKKSEELSSILKDSVDVATVNDIDENNTFTLSMGKNNSVFTFLKNDLNEVFWVVYSFHSSQRRIAQSMFFLFFSIGIVLLSVLFIKNLIVVLQSLI